MKSRRAENPERGTKRLPSHTSHRIAVVAIVVVLGVDAVVDFKVEFIRVVRIVDDRRPIVAVGANVFRVAIPVPGIGEIQSQTAMKNYLISSDVP